MNPITQRADLTPTPVEEGLSAPDRYDASYDSGFDARQWRESQDENEVATAGGRTVLASALVVLAILWVGYTAWSAGRSLAGESISSPALAQWVALGAGPLALMGLVWLMFGRTRRREAERFTRSVIAMRTEAQALEAVLGVLAARISDSESSLTQVTQRLMQLGDEATGKLDGVTREIDASGERLVRNGEALDRAAEAARTDLAVILDDLPKAEATARAIAVELRGAGSEATTRAAAYERQVTALIDRTREADLTVAGAAERLVAELGGIERAGSAATASVTAAETAFRATAETLLGDTAETLTTIRSGIDSQAAAIVALVEQASAALGRAGVEAAKALDNHVTHAGSELDGLSSRVAEQERATRSMLAEVDRAVAELQGKFTDLAAHGDERATAFVGTLARTRGELVALAQDVGAPGQEIEALASRTLALREGVERLSLDLGDELAARLAQAEAGTERLRAAAAEARPEIEWMRDAAAEASARIGESAAGIAEQQDRFAALLAALDDGVGGAGDKLAGLSEQMRVAQVEATNLTAETGPALVAAMVQVREAAAHAAERARTAISDVIPEGAAKLSKATREALEAAIREGIEDRLREVEATAARAIDAAKAASDRLTQQMLSIGQSAAALEAHIEATEASTREKDSEAFARRVSMLIDSMHSASIDVGKILADEIDDKAWDSYLKGNRGVFTRRAVRLLGGGETKAIRAHYETEPEFQQSVNRYVHDFEAMLRRVLAERDGGMIAVTLMSSDMGKLYAALAPAIDRRR